MEKHEYVLHRWRHQIKAPLVRLSNKCWAQSCPKDYIISKQLLWQYQNRYYLLTPLHCFADLTLTRPMIVSSLTSSCVRARLLIYLIVSNLLNRQAKATHFP